MSTPTLDYTVKSKHYDAVWSFKYTMEGDLKCFEILGGKLNDNQIKWLFNPENFPYRNQVIEQKWMALRKHFEITKGEIDLSFESFWNLYGKKIGKKVTTENTWKRLSKKDKLNAIIGIRHYDNHLRRNIGIAKAYASTYLNQRYWENDYKSS